MISQICWLSVSLAADLADVGFQSGMTSLMLIYTSLRGEPPLTDATEERFLISVGSIMNNKTSLVTVSLPADVTTERINVAFLMRAQPLLFKIGLVAVLTSKHRV